MSLYLYNIVCVIIDLFQGEPGLMGGVGPVGLKGVEVGDEFYFSTDFIKDELLMWMLILLINFLFH